MIKVEDARYGQSAVVTKDGFYKGAIVTLVSVFGKGDGTRYYNVKLPSGPQIDFHESELELADSSVAIISQML